ncbi:MAG: tRNA dihydrouridine synthase DusB [Clostridiales bacterium]
MKKIVNKVNIKNVKIKNKVFIAPMAGITDKVFRKILMEMGAGFCFTEMVSAKALLYQNKKTHVIMDIQGEEDCCGIQLFGSNPQEMATAAKIAANNGTPIIDINMGCPVPKVVNNSEGSALLKNIPLAVQIAEAVVNAVDIPVTVKVRKGFNGENAGIALVKELEKVGVAAVTVHGRNRVDYYSGKADWDSIKTVKESLNIPVIGNGDIFTAQAAYDMLNKTGCDGIMLARGVLGNPWLVRETLAFLNDEPLPNPPTSQERVEMAIDHLDACCSLYGEWLGIRYMRKFLGWYIKGFANAAKMRKEINTLTNRDEIKNLLLAMGKADEISQEWNAAIPPLI